MQSGRLSGKVAIVTGAGRCCPLDSCAAVNPLRLSGEAHYVAKIG
jgi:hypothetical protein